MVSWDWSYLTVCRHFEREGNDMISCFLTFNKAFNVFVYLMVVVITVLSVYYYTRMKKEK